MGEKRDEKKKEDGPIREGGWQEKVQRAVESKRVFLALLVSRVLAS